MTGHQIGRPRFITLSEALAFHALWIDEYGGSHGLRDQSLLESALAHPQAGFGDTRVHECPFGMAAAYAFHIAKNHPFVDGNKRAALGCCAVFLRMNGWNLRSEQEVAADQSLKLIDGSLNKEMFAQWLETRSKARVSWELRDFVQGLNAGQFNDIDKSLPVGSPSEKSATLHELLESVPIARSLLATFNRHKAEGDEAKMLITAGMLGMLLRMYRIAEEGGYDW